jgi:hypothetical protein
MNMRASQPFTRPAAGTNAIRGPRVISKKVARPDIFAGSTGEEEKEFDPPGFA